MFFMCRYCSARHCERSDPFRHLSRPGLLRRCAPRNDKATRIYPASLRFCEAIVERVAGAADGADRILLAAGIEQLAQAADMHVDGALVDVDVTAPDAVEQLLAREHPARMLEEEFEQAIFGRPEVDRAARARYAALLAVKLEFPIGEHGRKPLGACTAEQALHPRQELRHR